MSDQDRTEAAAAAVVDGFPSAGKASLTVGRKRAEAALAAADAHDRAAAAIAVDDPSFGLLTDIWAAMMRAESPNPNVNYRLLAEAVLSVLAEHSEGDAK